MREPAESLARPPTRSHSRTCLIILSRCVPIHAPYRTSDVQQRPRRGGQQQFPFPFCRCSMPACSLIIHVCRLQCHRKRCASLYVQVFDLVREFLGFFNFTRSMRCLEAEFKTRQLHLADGRASQAARDLDSALSSSSSVASLQLTADIASAGSSVFVADAQVGFPLAVS